MKEGCFGLGTVYSGASPRCSTCADRVPCLTAVVNLEKKLMADVPETREILLSHVKLLKYDLEAMRDERVTESSWTAAFPNEIAKDKDYLKDLTEAQKERISSLPELIQKLMVRLFKLGLDTPESWHDEKRVQYCPKDIQIVFESIKAGKGSLSELKQALTDENPTNKETTIINNLKKSLLVLHTLRVIEIDNNKFRLTFK